ncbi:helix-turn-helix domain-containing protein [Paenibacillus chartarius]|uniref:Helix-turn-helix domain-containing protein n=1 Tax=Paenibacillus chartarius TaxID=747481 RepID=A0ABV6DIL1_9BACL
MKPPALLEPMTMPDHAFPVKVGPCRASEYGITLFANHWHRHIELLYFVSGRAVVECNGVPVTAGPGDMIFMNANDLHAGICLSEDLFYYVLIFDPAVLQSQSMDAIESKYMLPIVQNLMLFPNFIAQANDYREDYLSIVKELGEKEPGYELAVKASLYRMLTRLIRSQPLTGQTAKEYRNRMRLLERLTPVLSFIEERSEEELTVEELAKLAGLSRFHFSRLFKQLTEKSVAEYVNDIRIRRADYLLRNTPMTVSEVALAVGYRDIYYFSRVFKKCRHVPPSEVRRG